jgi:peptide-methionine (S)-S-oxide reductase
MLFSRAKVELPSPDRALPGRDAPAFPIPETHAVNGHRIVPPFPATMRTAVFALGCFWAAERTFGQIPGVWSTAVGYAGGITPNPTYEEVCSGLTGHAEAVLVVYNPALVSYQRLLAVFWQTHDPTQGTGQGSGSRGKSGPDRQDFGVELSISRLAVRLTATSLVMTRR